ncbi:MAG TPA: type II toxin-antitoxin system prevent-host-death family antitoxin [Spirochaetaceae bacterium]|nr:type II toxin-antitoxin system prevent-host-death family antitoxin [Spirochaetaceae bacterium]
MKIESEKMISITEVSQNFSKAVKLSEKNGDIFIMKNNKPKYHLINLDNEVEIDMSDDEKVLFVAGRILKKHKRAFERLAE